MVAAGLVAALAAGCAGVRRPRGGADAGTRDADTPWGCRPRPSARSGSIAPPTPGRRATAASAPPCDSPPPTASSLAIADRLGRGLWTLRVEGDKGWWLDHRGDVVCRDLALLELPGLARCPVEARSLPPLLLGALPAAVDGPPPAGAGEVAVRDRAGRAWSVTLEDGRAVRWALLDAEGPLWWWRRDGRAASSPGAGVPSCAGRRLSSSRWPAAAGGAAGGLRGEAADAAGRSLSRRHRRLPATPRSTCTCRWWGAAPRRLPRAAHAVPDRRSRGRASRSSSAAAAYARGRGRRPPVRPRQPRLEAASASSSAGGPAGRRPAAESNGSRYGGGLGGGSSNAAAVLLALQQLLGDPAPAAELWAGPRARRRRSLLPGRRHGAGHRPRRRGASPAGASVTAAAAGPATTPHRHQ